jgi:hypothetical protein
MYGAGQARMYGLLPQSVDLYEMFRLVCRLTIWGTLLLGDYPPFILSVSNVQGEEEAASCFWLMVNYMKRSSKPVIIILCACLIVNVLWLCEFSFNYSVGLCNVMQTPIARL